VNSIKVLVNIVKGGRSNLGRALPFAGVCFGLLFCLPAHSQTLGRISGIVTDSSGGAIAGATVTVTDVVRGVPRTVTTDSSGAYVAPDLIQGTYTVHATYKGFQSFDRQDIVIGVAGDVHVDIRLEPGSQAQTVTVTGELPAITTTNAQLQGTISGQDLSDLPFSGHNYVQLLGLLPTFQLRPGSGSGPTQNNSNGLRGEYNVYVLDGVSDQMAYYTTSAVNGGQPAGGSEQAVMLPTDAIQEFNVVENSKAEFGWRPGAQLDVGIKSGTNAMHGTAFALGRDTALMARNPFFGASTPTAFENFGGSFGAPIKKDKLFYFLGYEAQRYDVGNPKTISVPTTTAGAGVSYSLPDAINALLTNGVTPSQLSLNLAGCVTVPAVKCTPNAGLFSNGQSGTTSAVTTFPVDFPSIGRTDNGVARVDYNLNEHNNLSAEFFDGNGPTLEPVSNVTQPYWETPLDVRTSVVRGWWTWIPSSTWVNDLRFGWDNSRSTNSPSYDCTAASGAPNYASLGFVGGGQTCGFPTITISGFTEGTGTNVLGGETGTNETSGLWRWVDSISYTHGSHIFKFGGEFVLARLSISLNTDQEKGTINFTTANAAFLNATSLENFMAGHVASATLLTGTLPRQFQYPAYAAFVQDDWRIIPRVTLNLGLRYEYTAPFQETNNQVGNINLGTPSGIIQAANGIPLYHMDPFAFAPRLGLAWDVTGKGKTVVRAGANIIYENPSVNPFITPGASVNTIPTGLPLKSATQTINPGPGDTINLHSLSLSSVPWQVGTSVFGGFVGTNSVCSNTAPCAIGGVTPKLEYPEVLNWNLGVQHAITNKLTLEASYVGNHGQHLFDYIDINQPNPAVPTAATTAGITSPGANSSTENAQRPYTLNGEFPWFSMLRVLGAISNFSNYNALQMTLRERPTHGLTFLAAFTYSHALDSNSSDLAMTPPQNAHAPYADYGNSSFDIRDRFTAGPSYVIPGRSGFAQMLQGWQVTSTVSIFSGRPINPTDAADDLSETGEAQDRWTLVGPASDFKFGRAAPIPCYDADMTTGAITTSKTWTSACTAGLPPACVNAAAAEPEGPGGSIGTATQELDRLGCYMMGSAVIVPPALGTFGQMSRYSIYGVGFWEWDMSIIKTWVIRERINTQFRAEFYNLTNSTQFYTPNAVLSSPSTFGESTATPDVGVNSPIIGTGGPRKIQFGLKFAF